MIIYRGEISIIDVELDDSSIFKHAIMGDEICEMNFVIEQFYNFMIGDYIYYSGQKFTLNTPHKISKIANNEYSYNLRFEGIKYELGKILFKLDTETEFFLNADIEQILEHVITNMNDSSGYVWTKGVCSITPYFNFQFSNENCLQVINKACLEFEVEFEVVADETGYTINVRDSIGIYDNIDLSYKSGIYQLSRESVGQENVITKVYAYGASKNIPEDYGYGRITIEPLTNNDDIYGIVESVLICDDIYPSFQGSVTSPGADFFTDSSIDFDINSYLISGVTPKVVFLSGDLAGYEFEISSYTHATKTIELVALVDDIGQTLPSSGLEISQFDKYTLVDLYMPDSYVEDAEAELLERAEDYIDRYSIPIVKYSIVIDARYLRDNEITLYAGQIIGIIDIDMGIDEQLRIYSISQSMANPYKYNIELTDELMVNRMIRLVYGQFDIQKALDRLRKELRILKNN